MVDFIIQSVVTVTSWLALIFFLVLESLVLLKELRRPKDGPDSH